MTTLVHKIEKLIKREKITPDRKNDDSTKTSSEILTEIFSAFNADPPKIDDAPTKKNKKAKKKHKKEKKKRSRSGSSCSDSELSEYSRKRKKSKKVKSKKHKDSDRSPSRRHTKSKSDLVHSKKETKEVIAKEQITKTVKNDKASSIIHKNSEEVKVKEEVRSKTPTPIINTTKVSKLVTPTFNSIDASLIPMPEAPKTVKVVSEKSKPKFNTKEPVEVDKSKGKIQIKNLKFSTVFEETVKKAEEEARKKAEKEEDGEYTASSSGSEVEEDPNSQFPKSADPGGILKQQAAEETKACEEEKEKVLAQKEKVKESESSLKSKKERSSSLKRSRSKSKRSRSRSTSRHRSSKRHRSHYRSRSRSRRRSRGYDSPTSRSRKHSKSRSRHKSRSRSRHRSPRSWNRRRSRSPSGVKLADSEKKRLLEVARRNAINMLKNGAVPAGAAALPPHTRSQVMAAIQSGGKSVDELTDFCKHLSKKEALGELSSVSSNDEDMSDNEDTIAFHHPFLVKEKAPIIVNIRGVAPLPTKTSALPSANKDELRLQFPVSSGTQHRASEWVPVSPKKDEPTQEVSKLNSPTPDSPLPVPDPTLALPPTPPPGLVPTPPPETTNAKAPVAQPEPRKNNTPLYLKSFTSGTELQTVPLLPAPGPQALPPNMESRVDVQTIVSQKLALIRQEQEHTEACETRGFGWSKTSLGEFTGSTDANILTPRELASGTQAWAKKDQLVRAAPVEGGMGMHLLQKMGWTPGQGLGKEGTGTLQPLLLEVKLDTRGLQAREEINNKIPKSQRVGRRGPAPLVAGGKHPVSLLGEYTSKNKLGPPEYSLCFECGPDHKKNFLFKVKVAGVDYQPAVASANKKQAKADAAQLALQKLGILTII